MFGDSTAIPFLIVIKGEEMGGSIKVAIRRKDGQQHVVDGWTGSMTAFCKNVKFITKDESYIDSYIEDEGGSGAVFSPDGYGLVVFDQMNNKIYTHQNYSTFDDFHNASLGMSGNENVVGETKLNSLFNDFIQFLESGRIYKVEGINPKVDIPLEHIVGGRVYSCSMKDWLSNNNIEFDSDGKLTSSGLDRLKEVICSFPIGNSNGTDNVFEEARFFDINMAPFEIINLHDDKHGFHAMFNMLKQDGFQFTEEDLKAWEEWFDDSD